jgi:UDP-2,3-diacylglucosamine pyrophosphatase LpxH
MAGAALLPASALAASEPLSLDGAPFSPDFRPDGPKPWTSAPNKAGPLRFAVIGDNTGIARPGIFDRGLQQISWLQPDFILSVGDLIEGYTEDRTEIARQWNAIETSVAKAGVPFIYTPGNHDMDNAETLDAWRERRGPGYYSFTYKGALFIILNTEDTPTPMPAKMASQIYGLIDLMKVDPEKADKTIVDYLGSGGSISKGEYSALEVVHYGDRQLAFVRDTLAKHPNVRWTFVITHKPAWKMEGNSFAPIQAMMKGRPYTVFAGHTHYFTHEVFDGADYINMGTTGGIRQQMGPGTMDHTVLVTLAKDGPTFANLRLSGLMDAAGQTGQGRLVYG